jgi:hypothetical protein
LKVSDRDGAADATGAADKKRYRLFLRREQLHWHHELSGKSANVPALGQMISVLPYCNDRRDRFRILFLIAGISSA